jgi:glycosyltransferase involved in cell wall biosynthesis
MKIAFYYHIPIIVKPDGLYVPGYLGVFVNELANNCETLYYIAHQARKHEEDAADYKIPAKNISFVDLGLKTPSWYREIFHKRVLKKPLKQINECDVLIVRAPTPLAAYFYKYLNKTKIWYLVVGDYLEATDHYRTTTFRNKLIYYYLHINDYFFQKRIKKTPLLVNSPSLYDKYKKVNDQVFLIRTTTLSQNDFFYREDTSFADIKNIVYAGSYSPAKGLFELLDAFQLLIEEGTNAKLHLVGWEDNPDKPVEVALRKKCEVLGISDLVVFHGKKKIGPDLNAMYRMADVYVIPSHHEGFPRTIWEAMANGAPVVATAVGGIPRFLENGKNAILIEPQNIIQIKDALYKVLNDRSLRKKLMKEAYATVADNTLEVQTHKMVSIIKDYLKT